ncbi:hypothetical protein CDAR_405181 [Caerostris darwini]|uniref:Uncharacterized protein n=1 Tax=Caerostris darwini TaxID=1538125 RepID=A0AAV4U6Q3_9ARAC|nr:hypothetical protein CDAR_405181 [Caerostris darwini]
MRFNSPSDRRQNEVHKEANSISTPILSRWPLASETTFVLWTRAKLAALNLPRVSISIHLNEWFSIHPVCRDVSVRFRASLSLLPLFMNADGFGKKGSVLVVS